LALLADPTQHPFRDPSHDLVGVSAHSLDRKAYGSASTQLRRARSGSVERGAARDQHHGYFQLWFGEFDANVSVVPDLGGNSTTCSQEPL